MYILCLHVCVCFCDYTCACMYPASVNVFVCIFYCAQCMIPNVWPSLQRFVPFLHSSWLHWVYGLVHTASPNPFFFWHNKTDFWKSLGSKKHHMKSGLQSAICVTRNTAKKQQHQLQSAGSAGIHAATSRAPKNLLTHMPSPQRTMQIGWWRLDTHIRFDHLQITVCIKGSHLRTKSDLPAVWTTS